MQDVQLIKWKKFNQTPSANSSLSKGGWTKLEDITYIDAQYDVITTVGFKVKENEDFISLASSINKDKINGVISINKRNIISSNLLNKNSAENVNTTSKICTNKSDVIARSNSTRYTNLKIPATLRNVNFDEFIKCAKTMSNKELENKFNLTYGYVGLLKAELRKHKLMDAYEGLKPGISDDEDIFKRLKVSEKDFIKAYNSGLSYNEMSERFKVSRGSIGNMANYCYDNNKLDKRGRGYIWKNDKIRLRNLKQYVKDNYMSMTYKEMAEDNNTCNNEITTMVDSLVKSKQLEKWGKPFHGTKCVNRNPLVAYGIDLKEWCKCFKTMQDWQMAIQFNVPQSSIRPISDAIIEHYPNGSKMLYGEGE